MTKKQLDRALLKMFNQEEPCVRGHMPPILYDYAWKLWAKSRKGQREIAANPWIAGRAK